MQKDKEKLKPVEEVSIENNEVCKKIVFYNSYYLLYKYWINQTKLT